jgi:hypothetical protein
MRKWKAEGWDVRAIFDYALSFHASHMNNKSAPIPEELRDEVARFLRRLGYRLVLRKLEHPRSVAAGGRVTLALAWENAGVAPPYRDDRLAFRFTDAAGKTLGTIVGKASIRGWLPGEKAVQEEIDAPSVPGTYGLSVAVVDPASKEPAVRLAIAGRSEDGWYPLSRIEVR